MVGGFRESEEHVTEPSGQYKIEKIYFIPILTTRCMDGDTGPRCFLVSCASIGTKNLSVKSTEPQRLHPLADSVCLMTCVAGSEFLFGGGFSLWS